MYVLSKEKYNNNEQYENVHFYVKIASGRLVSGFAAVVAVVVKNETNANFDQIEYNRMPHTHSHAGPFIQMSSFYSALL